MLYSLTAHFEKGYIAEPYWPEMEKLINIQKESGMNRARSAANRRKALEEHLKSTGMTLAEYDELERRAKRPFHTNGAIASADACATATAIANADAFASANVNEIVIPADRVASFLVNVCDVARAAHRPCNPDQVRSVIKCSDWHTGKIEADGVWERFAQVTAGTGQKLSNQRGLRRSQYIEQFDAHGTVEINPEFVKPSVLENAIRWGGENVGIGASRKMGWGRFTLTGFAQQ